MKTALIAAVVALTATTGIASAQSAGQQQLANLLQVNGAEFSSAELIAIQDARRDGNRNNETYFLTHENRHADMVGDVSQGKAQIAAQLGVDPAEYTLAELVNVSSNLRQNEVMNADFVLSGGTRNEIAPIAAPYRGQGRD